MIFRAKSREQSRFFYISLLLMLLGILLSWIFADQMSLYIFEKTNERNMAFIYGVEKSSDKEVLARVLQGDYDRADVQNGKTLLGNYGFSDKESLRFLPGFSDLRLSVFIGCSSICLLVGSFILLYGLSRFSRLSKDLIHISNITEALSGMVQKGQTEDLKKESSASDAKYKEDDMASLYRSVGALAELSKNRMQVLDEKRSFMQDYLSDISHQIRTPLSALSLYHELLLKDPHMPVEERIRFQQTGLEQIHRISWLVEGLLQIARLEAGVVLMETNACAFRDTIESACKPYWEMAKNKSVQIENETAPEIFFPHDTKWLAEAFGNLIKNALEYTPEGGKIRIWAEKTPVSIQVFVADTGVGIPSKEIPFIFQRFYRVNAKQKPSGIGIGLSLSKAIIEKNGGELFVKSVVGQGTTFTATFLLG